ncbi:MAG: FG-GAP-like repeat-containing protein [Gemmatimonadaceae bacterium]
MDIVDVSPTRLNTDASGIGHSVAGRMLSIACTQDGKELYVGSYANLWTSQNGGKRWDQLTWPQPDPAQFTVPGAIGGWCVVDIAATLGWRVEKHPRLLGRLTSSGLLDIVGFGECGMWTALGNGDGTFQQPNVVNAEFGLLAGGWQVDKHPRFLADLNNDGCDDVVGFGYDGVWIAIGNGDGTFQTPRFVVGDLGFNQGWRIDKHPRFAVDLNGDGNADVIGFGDAGVWAAIGTGTGDFGPAQFVHANFGIQQGWRVDKHPRFVADLDKDGRADIVGFGDAGVLVAFQNPDGSFREPSVQPVLADFGVQQGWRVDKHPRFVVDLDNDGYPDIIGFGEDGTWTAINDRNGGFSAPRFTQDLFSFNTGWRVDKHPRVVLDLNGDGIADIIGFGDDGVWTAIGNGDGTFQPAQFVQENFGVNQGWRVDRHPRFVAKLAPNRVGVVGFGDAGVWSAVGDGFGGFPSSNFVLSSFGYGTVVLALVANDRSTGSRGLWRSTDGGANWTQVHRFAPFNNLGEIHWAQGSDHLVYVAGGSSLAISKNAGATFVDVFPWGNGPSARVNHVAAWLSEVSDPFPAVLYALGNGTMFVSFDGGVTWTRDTGPVPVNVGGLTSQVANGTSAHVMVISPSCPLQLFVAQDGSGAATPAALYRADYSRFMGTSASRWDQIPLPDKIVDPKTQDAGNTFLLGTQRGRGDLLYYGAQRFAENNQQAAAWVGPMNATSPSDWHRLDPGHVDLHGFLLSPDFRASFEDGEYRAGGGTLWMLSDGGVYRSTNGGADFVPTESLMTLSCLSVAGVAINGKGVALSLNSGDNDGFYSMDGGQHWSYQQYGGGDNDCSFADPLRPHALMVFTPRWDTAANSTSARLGTTVSVYQTSPGNLPNASASGHDRKAVTGPPTLQPDEPSRVIWNGSSSFGAKGSCPIVLGLADEEAPDQGDYVFVLDPNGVTPVVVRTHNIFDIKHRDEWITTATGPGQGANVFLQGPPLPEPGLSVLQAAGGHANPVYYAGGNGNLWRLAPGGTAWNQIVPALPNRRSAGARTATRFFAHPYQPSVVYLLDSDHVKRTDNGGSTWLIDQSLETQLTWNGQIAISSNADPAGIGEFFDLVLTNMTFHPNLFAARFAVGAGGAFMTTDGTTWTRLIHSAALPGRPSSCFLDFVSESDASLYVAFAGRSVVKVTGLGLSVIF